MTLTSMAFTRIVDRIGMLFLTFQISMMQSEETQSHLRHSFWLQQFSRAGTFWIQLYLKYKETNVKIMSDRVKYDWFNNDSS